VRIEGKADVNRGPMGRPHLTDVVEKGLEKACEP
jgi:hypothetical protein